VKQSTSIQFYDKEFTLLTHKIAININHLIKGEDVSLSKDIHYAYTNFLTPNARLRQEKTSKNKRFFIRRLFYWVRSEVAFNGTLGQSQYPKN